MEHQKSEIDVVAEQGRSSTANEKLWIYITPLDKSQELSRLFIGNKTVSLRYAKSVVQPADSNSSYFSVRPTSKNRNSGNFRAIEFNVYGISAGSKVEICVHVNGLRKGDKFEIFSSYAPYGFKQIAIKKYDLNSQLQLIHEKSNISNSPYSVNLDWPWIES